MNMKVRDIVEKLPERPKKSVFKCYEKCGLPEMEAELEPEVDREIIEFLKALSNPIRLKILKLTRDNWLCVCLLSEVLGEDQTLISHHLRTLKTLDLVKERREGRMRFYKANTERIEELLKKVEGVLVGYE
ncbi:MULTISPECIES: ArsR/SmtB family transcription factor [Thermococcus]